MRNKRRHVQATFMSARGEALSSGELPREVHPLRPKPVVNPDDVEARWLIILSNTNGKRPRLRDELNRISQLRGNEICDSTGHAPTRTLLLGNFRLIGNTASSPILQVLYPLAKRNQKTGLAALWF